MRVDDLKIGNLTTTEQLEVVREIIDDITGAKLLGADLENGLIEFEIQEDLDDLDLTTVQCALRERGFDAGEIVEGQTCKLRFRRS
jgi:hypothetical protein